MAELATSPEAYDGTHRVPQLQGVRGRIRLVGPMVTRDLIIDDGKVTVSPAEDTNVDCTITCFEPLDQIRMIRGDLNLVTGLLQGRLEAEGDPMLAVRIAGSIRGLGTITPQVAR